MHLGRALLILGLPLVVAGSLLAAKVQDDETLLAEPEAKQQWRNKVIPIPKGDAKAIERQFDDLGRFGWEFSGTVHSETGEELAVFKKVKQ